ncbi:hypothetical protein D3228_15035 [Leucobacter luti]|nr:hypothetical protein [Leucobacter luti]
MSGHRGDRRGLRHARSEQRLDPRDESVRPVPQHELRVQQRGRLRPAERVRSRQSTIEHATTQTQP